MAEQEQEQKEQKVVRVPQRRGIVEEREIDLGERGVFVIKPTTRRVLNEANVRYSKAWFEGIKNGLYTENKLRQFVKEHDLLTEAEKRYGGDVFELIEKSQERVNDLQRQMDAATDEDERQESSKELVTEREHLNSLRGVVRDNLAPTVEDIAESARESVVMSSCVFQKLEDGKRVKFWKTPEDYDECADTGLSVALRIEQVLLDANLPNDEETILERFTDIADLILSARAEKEGGVDE